MPKFTSETGRLASIAYHKKAGHKLSPSSSSDYVQRRLRIKEAIGKLPSLVRFYFVVDYRKGLHPVRFEASWVGYENQLSDFKDKTNDFIERIDENIARAFDNIGIRIGSGHIVGDAKKGDTSVIMDKRLEKYGLKEKWERAMRY